MVTVRLPWLTAALRTLTPCPITTVPVRLLKTTLGRSLPMSTWMSCSRAMKEMRWLSSRGAAIWMRPALTALATGPS
ncbi:hypothetical protein D3C74_448290 [compost metagenome]